MRKTTTALKRVFVGRPMAWGELEHTLLPKIIALPVFSSDPLSSNAYATQEILLVLALAGAAALNLVFPIAIAVALLLVVVVTSYRQTVQAYPGGGGAYRVSRENIGMHAGLLAASALLTDYVLTVAVSVTAGVDALVSVAPEAFLDVKIPLTLGFVLFVTLANLRGVKESGTFFAIPTYGFVVSIYLMLLFGLGRCVFGSCPLAESAGASVEPEHVLGLALVFRAFAAGTTALTGVEAIADGVQAFRYPQSRNAAATLGVMAVLSTSMFLGISWLAHQTHVVFIEGAPRTVVAQIAHAVFGGGFMFYVLQIMTAGILILAANTAYQDFPRLSSILAQDRFMPRQFINRGDRLVFSNGIIILALLASVLILVFDANLNSLIQLYLVGVFISFTLSQTGMVLRFRKIKGPRWKHRALVSGVGAAVTGTVFFVILGSKFGQGAWIVVSAIPVLIYLMYSIHRHYHNVAEELREPQRRPVDRRPGDQHVVIFIDEVDAAAARAVGYARSLRPAELSAVTFAPEHAGAWNRLAPEIPLTLLPARMSGARSLRRFLKGKRKSLEEDDFLTLVVPEVLRGKGLFEIIRRPWLHRLKGLLLFEEGVQVLDVPVPIESIDPSVDLAHEPARNLVCVLVAGVHNATLQAIEYAETLRPTDLRAVTFGLDPTETEKIGDEWLAQRIPHRLEIEDSPFRDIGRSILAYVRRFRPDGLNRVVTVVLPEFVVRKRRHQLLHGQTALIVKRHLLFEPGVVVVSVPYHLKGE